MNTLGIMEYGNTTSGSSYDDGSKIMQISGSFVIMAASTYALFAVMGVTFNITGIYIIVVGKRTSPKVKIQLINLAVADILTALFDPCFVILNIIGFPFTMFQCKVWYFFCHVFRYAGILCNVAICLERLVIVFFPLRPSRHQKKHKYIVVALIWICSTAAGVPTAIPIGYKIANTSVVCAVDLGSKFITIEIFMMILIIKYALPPAIITVVYVAVILKLYSRRPIGQIQNDSARLATKLGNVSCIT